MRRKPRTALYEYVYYSDRLGKNIVEQAAGRYEWRPAMTVAIRPAGIGGDVGFSRTPVDHATRASQVAQIDRLLDGWVVEQWDPRLAARYARGKGPVFWGNLRTSSAQATAVAMVGCGDFSQAPPVLFCLFGSLANLSGRASVVDESRLFGWTSSTNEAITFLLGLDHADPLAWDEESAFAAVRYVDPRELAFTAANVVLGQGQATAADRSGLVPSRLRGYLIGEGNMEWLARIYLWCEDVHVSGRQYRVAVGAPVYLRTRADDPARIYGPGARPRRRFRRQTS